jgi:putative nucleotidyltransferase with HDIG domain
MDPSSGKHIDYQGLLDRIRRDLPTLPSIVNELTTILNNPDSSTFAVEEIMTSDQSMTMKILRVANTAFYRGARERVADANEAIGTLGFEKIRNVILTSSVFEMFSGPSAEKKFSLEELWKHSLGVAVASSALTKYLGRAGHDRAYTCGLVHDIGKVARYKLNQEEFVNDCQYALDKKMDFLRVELANQTPRHDYLGYLICKSWGLSRHVEAVVRWHHESNPEHRLNVHSDETHEVIDIVSLANWMVHVTGFGFSGHDHTPAPSDALLARLTLVRSQLPTLMESVQRELETTEDFVNVLEPSSE